MDNELRNRIRKHRKTRKLTQEQLAELCSVTPPTISRWENGSLTPSHEHKLLLSEALKIDLVNSDEQQNPTKSHTSTLTDIVEIISKMDEAEQELILDLVVRIDKHLESLSK